MKKVLAVFLLLCSPAVAADLIYEGTWVTTNRKLDGPMTCHVTRKGNEAWKGRFFGVWQGVRFDYTVDFTGPADKLVGKATIDGARYTWKGKLDKHSPGKFDGTFTGTRYDGYFRLKQKIPKK